MNEETREVLDEFRGLLNRHFEAEKQARERILEEYAVGDDRDEVRNEVFSAIVENRNRRLGVVATEFMSLGIRCAQLVQDATFVANLLEDDVADVDDLLGVDGEAEVGV